MNYGLAFVFSYERFENALICIISIRPSTELRPIFNFPIFRKNGASMEFLNIVFEYCIFVELKKIRIFWHGARFSIFKNNGS